MQQAESFIRDEKEGLVLAMIQVRNPYRPSKRPSEVVLSERSNWNAQIIVEPIVGIEGIVPQIIESAAMPLIGP